MSQFATMLPMQSFAPNLKTAGTVSAEGLQPGSTGEVQDLDFLHTLQDLSASNPNAAALLLALQQAGILSGQTAALQTGGSVLPPLNEAGGNALPQAAVQAVQLNSLTAVQSDSLATLEPVQLQKLLGEVPLENRFQTLNRLIQSGAARQAFHALESRGSGDLVSPLQGMGSQIQSAQAAASQRPTIVLPVQVPVGQPGWDNTVGERIQWMMSRHVQQAEIKLSPPELGPVEIKISLQNDQTNIHFLANHSATRDALEAAIPRLRELFGDINLNLANVDVNQRQAGDAGTQHGSAGSAGGTGNAAGEEGSSSMQDNPGGVVRLQSQGLLDTYV